MSEEESISVLFTEEEQALLKQSPQSLYETVLVLLARPCLEVFQALSASFIFGKAVSSPSKKHKRDGRKELFDSITASIVMNHKNKKEFSYLEFAQALQQWTDRWQQFTFEAILSTVLFLDSTLEGYIHLGSVERLCNLLDDSLRSNPLHVEVTVQDSFLVLVSSLHTTLYSSSGHLHNPNNEVSSSKVSALFRRIQALVVDAHRCNIATLAPYLRKISLREGKQRAANQDETLHHDIMTYLQTLHVKTHRALQALQVSAAGSPQSDRSQLLDITQSTLPITPAQKLTNKTLNTSNVSIAAVKSSSLTTPHVREKIINSLQTFRKKADDLTKSLGSVTDDDLAASMAVWQQLEQIETEVSEAKGALSRQMIDHSGTSSKLNVSMLNMSDANLSSDSFITPQNLTSRLTRLSLAPTAAGNQRINTSTIAATKPAMSKKMKMYSEKYNVLLHDNEDEEYIKAPNNSRRVQAVIRTPLNRQRHPVNANVYSEEKCRWMPSPALCTKSASNSKSSSTGSFTMLKTGANNNSRNVSPNSSRIYQQRHLYSRDQQLYREYIAMLDTPPPPPPVHISFALQSNDTHLVEPSQPPVFE